jgi:C1A family cysteine protease
VNQFADLTADEFRARFLMDPTLFAASASQRHAHCNVIDYSHVDTALPASYDWRNNGSVVTPVKNQEQCGSCWAFSTTENIESVWAIAGNGLVELAPQQIVDCDTTDDGCNGGNPPTAYEYVIKAGGLEKETVRIQHC